MAVTIDGIVFDHSHYDADGDVLYLSLDPPPNGWVPSGLE
jgi:hypothetical protein